LSACRRRAACLAQRDRQRPRRQDRHEVAQLLVAEAGLGARRDPDPAVRDRRLDQRRRDDATVKRDREVASHVGRGVVGKDAGGCRLQRQVEDATESRVILHGRRGDGRTREQRQATLVVDDVSHLGRSLSEGDEVDPTCLGGEPPDGVAVQAARDLDHDPRLAGSGHGHRAIPGGLDPPAHDLGEGRDVLGSRRNAVRRRELEDDPGDGRTGRAARRHGTA
jgi:hypothetical protein